MNVNVDQMQAQQTVSMATQNVDPKIGFMFP